MGLRVLPKDRIYQLLDEANVILSDPRSAIREVDRLRSKSKKSVTLIVALKSLLDQEDQDQSEYLLGCSIRLSKWIARLDRREATLFVYHLIDSYAARVANRVTCRKGCSFCCNQQVTITDGEADLINELVGEDPSILISLENLLAQRLWDVVTEEGPGPKNWNDKPWEQRRCAFLSENGLCSIYQFRPSACRNHRSIDPPDLCDERKGLKDGIRFVNQLEIAMFLNAYMHSSKEEGPIAKMVLASNRG